MSKDGVACDNDADGAMTMAENVAGRGSAFATRQPVATQTKLGHVTFTTMALNTHLRQYDSLPQAI